MISPHRIIIISLLIITTIPFRRVDAKEHGKFFSNIVSRHKSFVLEGDINVGAFINTQAFQSGGCHAENTYLTSYTIEQTEAVNFAVNFINENPEILPNVTLGFVILGICKDIGTTLATSLLYVPENPGLCHSHNSSCAATAEADSQKTNWVDYDVIGALSTGSSRYTKPLASLYAETGIPLVGPTETSNDLSSTTKYPTFYRIIPPQRYQIDAMLKFISSNGWSYISIVYSGCEGSFTDTIKKLQDYGICTAARIHMPYSSDADVVAENLEEHLKARVVVVYITSSYFKALLVAVEKRNLSGHFIFLGTSGFGSYSGISREHNLSMDPAIGTFYFDAYSRWIPEFYDHMISVDVSETKNPWFRDVWEYLFDCSLKTNSCDTNTDVLHSSKYQTYKGTALRIDGILTLALAAHNLLSENCPDARGKEARACITGELYRTYLQNVSFDGFVAPIKFDEDQNVVGRYSLKQIVYDYHPGYSSLLNTNLSRKLIYGKERGFYDVGSGKFTFSEEEITWSHLKPLERILPRSPGSLASPDIPESVCSRPCQRGEYKLEKKVSCCWECRRCRDNERFIDNANTSTVSSCEACPSFTWPDPTSGLTTCADIPPTYSALPDTIPLVLTCVGGLALVVTFCVAVMYFIYRNERVIKASSRELSAIQLTAIFVGYSTVIMFQTAPSDNICRTVFVMFCMSFATLYSPLLAKSSRIYRIFKSGARNERPRLISPKSQVIFTLSLITVQMALCVSTFILDSPRAHRVQPVWTEKMVEMSCDLTLPGLASFLAYNVVLVSLCSVFAFLTRKLPDNFNESKFTSMCVSTTLLIWLAFIPTYFTAGREFVRVFLLSVALILNHSVAIIFLFFPKIYAAVFLEDAGVGHATNKI